jgi:2-polyprenyl-3-methyl-5-hydroxy-6-metoxy-1,4-benzoquinol methylase
MKQQSTISLNPSFESHIEYTAPVWPRVDRFRERKVVPELIDDFSISGDALDLTLTELEWVNKYLGGLHTSVMPVFQFMQEHRNEKVTVADVGCGSGDALNRILQVCKAAQQKVKLIGLDANIHALHYAIKNHFEKEDVALMYADVLKEPENIPEADVYVLSLFLHHFSFTDIRKLMENIADKQPKMIVINDLERSRTAYGLFTILSKLKRTSYLSLHDGQLSITKGFNRKEMEMISTMLRGYSGTVQHKWAFRWQLVLKRDE